MAQGAFIPARGSLEDSLQLVEQAERLGYEATYIGQMAGRDALTVLAACAARTERVKLATGITPIYARSPTAMAQAAATLDEVSGGRMVLGLGVSQPAVVKAWHGSEMDRPARDMREYVGAVRAILRGEDPPESQRFPTQFRFLGYEARPDLPIYLAALSPTMLRLAGEIAEGVIVRLCNPDYIREVVVPAVCEGRARAGKPLEGFEIVASVPAAVTDEPGDARSKLRADLALWFCFPSYRTAFARGGYGEEVAAFDVRMAESGSEAAGAGISDRFVEGLAAIGSADEAAAALRAYVDAGATSPSIRPISGTDPGVTLATLAGATAPLEAGSPGT